MTPLMARLSLSVAPEVKTISCGSPSIVATSRRSRSMNFVCSPRRNGLETVKLPGPPEAFQLDPAAEEVRLPALRAYARRVFAETAGADPARFLIPAMAAHGVTLDYLAWLHHQAALARIDGTADYKGPADLFEALRPGLYQARDPVFRTATRVARLRRELAEAASKKS